MTRKRWDDKRRRFAYTLAFAVTPDSVPGPPYTVKGDAGTEAGMTRKRWDDKRRRFAYTLAFTVTPDSVPGPPYTV